jgi:hypothetical protein
VLELCQMPNTDECPWTTVSLIWSSQGLGCKSSPDLEPDWIYANSNCMKITTPIWNKKDLVLTFDINSPQSIYLASQEILVPEFWLFALNECNTLDKLLVFWKWKCLVSHSSHPSHSVPCGEWRGHVVLLASFILIRRHETCTAMVQLVTNCP